MVDGQSHLHPSSDKRHLASPCPRLLVVRFCQLPSAIQPSEASAEVPSALYIRKLMKKRRRWIFFCQIMEWNQLTEGAGASSKDEQSRRSRRGERPPLFGCHKPFGWPTVCGLEHSRRRTACSLGRWNTSLGTWRVEGCLKPHLTPLLWCLTEGCV